MNATPFFSVIIPVFNAENYLRKAVQSALQFSCVKEVLLIEDASPDNALALCEKLAEEDNRIKVFTHPNNENKGAGASRNLGIEKSTCDFIAFLDADDWYLPNRFDAEKIIFQDENIDGVYGATGFFYQETDTIDPSKLTTILPVVRQENLLFEFVRPYGGRFTTNAITYRKSFLKNIGLFETNLRLHQDTELFIRSIVKGNLESGICTKPIAYRRVHDNNRIINAKKADKILFYETILLELMQEKPKIESSVLRVLVKSLVIEKSTSNSLLSRIIAGTNLFLKQPNWIIRLL